MRSDKSFTKKKKKVRRYKKVKEVKIIEKKDLEISKIIKNNECNAYLEINEVKSRQGNSSQ